MCLRPRSPRARRSTVRCNPLTRYSATHVIDLLCFVIISWQGVSVGRPHALYHVVVRHRVLGLMPRRTSDLDVQLFFQQFECQHKHCCQPNISLICNDNSTRCKQWHAEQKVKRKQVRCRECECALCRALRPALPTDCQLACALTSLEHTFSLQVRVAMTEHDVPEASRRGGERRVSLDTPDIGPKAVSNTAKTSSREVVLSLALNFDWPKANEKAFKAALVVDLVRALDLDNATVSVSGIFADAATNGTKVTVRVKGDENNAAMEKLTSPEDAKNMSFASLTNVSKAAKGPMLLSGISMTAPTSVPTSEAVKINTANFKKEMVKRPGYDKLPQMHGMDTTPKELLERAAKIEDMDPSKDVQDGKSVHERQIAAIVGELLGLLGAEVTKKTKFNANAMQQLVLGKHANGPEFKKRMAGLGKELGNMLRPEL